MSKKLAVFFPGRKYSVDCPLLYYADFVCSKKGYEKKYLHYAKNRDEKGNTKVLDDINNAKPYVIEKIKEIKIEEYDEVVFISKSIGTALAGYVREEFGFRNIKNVYLTPLPETLSYIEKENTIVIAGTNDSFLDADALKNFCVEKDVKIYQLNGLGHSLEGETVYESLEILGKVSKIIEEFV